MPLMNSCKRLVRFYFYHLFLKYDNISNYDVRFIWFTEKKKKKKKPYGAYFMIIIFYYQTKMLIGFYYQVKIGF